MLNNLFLAPHLCGFRKIFKTQQALLALTENWSKVLYNQSFGGAVLMDLSKVFDTINHDLLIAKPYARDFSNNRFKLLYSFLKSDSHLPKKIVICFIESLLKMMKNDFYFILKALFVLKIFKLLSRRFG